MEIELEPRADERGWFARTFCQNEFNGIAPGLNWVQLNQSMNFKRGTFRGLHYQIPPFQEIKLVRCLTGRVLDLAVDLRRHSKTFLQTYQTELSAENFRMLLIPAGFAHGFLTLEDNTQLLYHHDQFFKPEADRGLRFSDPQLKMKLPFQPLVLSDKDREAPLLPSDFQGLEL